MRLNDAMAARLRNGGLILHEFDGQLVIVPIQMVDRIGLARRQAQGEIDVTIGAGGDIIHQPSARFGEQVFGPELHELSRGDRRHLQIKRGVPSLLLHCKIALTAHRKTRTPEGELADIEREWRERELHIQRGALKLDRLRKHALRIEQHLGELHLPDKTFGPTVDIVLQKHMTCSGERKLGRAQRQLRKIHAVLDRIKIEIATRAFKFQVPRLCLGAARVRHELPGADLKRAGIGFEPALRIQLKPHGRGQRRIDHRQKGERGALQGEILARHIGDVE